jgi:hypothetical protein
MQNKPIIATTPEGNYYAVYYSLPSDTKKADIPISEKIG